MKTGLFISLFGLLLGMYLDSAPLGLLSIVAFFFFCIYGIVKYFTNKDVEEEEPLQAEESTPGHYTFTVSVADRPRKKNDFFCKIAGVSHHNTQEDIGGFVGYVKAEPENPYDPNAIAIYNNSGKLMGYIPGDKLQAYREWTSKSELNCVGFIRPGEEVALFGKVKILDCASMPELEIEILRFVRWMVDNFGLKYFPGDMNFTDGKKPRSKKALLEMINEAIEAREAEMPQA